MTSRHNLKIGNRLRLCACGNPADSSGQCRDCFLAANPDLAEYYDSHPAKQQSAAENSTDEPFEIRPGWINSNRDLTPITTLADKMVTAYNDWQAFISAVDSIDGFGMMGDRE